MLGSCKVRGGAGGARVQYKKKIITKYNYKGMKRNVFLSLFWLLLPISVGGRVVTGRVIDNDGSTIAFANVMLMCDTTFVAGSTTDDAGLFTIEDNGTANKLWISKAGYEDLRRPINQSTDVGTIIMKHASMMLGEVVVDGNLPTTQIKGNAIVTKV